MHDAAIVHHIPRPRNAVATAARQPLTKVNVRVRRLAAQPRDATRARRDGNIVVQRRHQRVELTQRAARGITALLCVAVQKGDECTNGEAAIVGETAKPGVGAAAATARV